jgi:hypothetical protein
MAAPPTSTKTSLQQRLSARARKRWPQLAGVDVRFRGGFPNGYTDVCQFTLVKPAVAPRP